MTRQHRCVRVAPVHDEDTALPSPQLEPDLTALLANTRRLRADLSELLALTAPYEVKKDCRQTGVSMHVRYREKLDIIDSLRWANFVSDSPSLVVHILGQLEAALVLLEAGPEPGAS